MTGKPKMLSTACLNKAPAHAGLDAWQSAPALYIYVL